MSNPNALTSFDPQPTLSSLLSDLLFPSSSTQTTSLPSRESTNSISSTSIKSPLPSISLFPSSSSYSVSSQATATTFATQPAMSSATQTSSVPFTPAPAPASSESSPNSAAVTVILVCVITIFIIVMALLAFLSYKARRRSTGVETELALGAQNTPRPWSDMPAAPGLIRRTTTSRVREDWQKWIARPPPSRVGLRRRDSAGLSGAPHGGLESRLSSCEPLLTAHEVEASGVLRPTAVSDPPPAYTPRRT